MLRGTGQRFRCESTGNNARFQATGTLRVSLGLGLVLVLLSVSYAAYALAVWASGEAMQGWTSILISVLLIGGVQLVSIGVVGEYVGRVFTEVKGRPLYLIDEDTVERESCLSAALSE